EAEATVGHRGALGPCDAGPAEQDHGEAAGRQEGARDQERGRGQVVGLTRQRLVHVVVLPTAHIPEQEQNRRRAEAYASERHHDDAAHAQPRPPWRDPRHDVTAATRERELPRLDDAVAVEEERLAAATINDLVARSHTDQAVRLAATE